MGDEVQRGKPVPPANEFGRELNQVPTDRTAADTLVAQSTTPMQDEVYGGPRGDSRGLKVPAGADIDYVNGRVTTDGTGNIYINADKVYINTNDGRGDVDPRVVRLENTGDLIDENCSTPGHCRVGTGPYYQPGTGGQTYHDLVGGTGDFRSGGMYRNSGGNNILLSAVFGRHGNHGGDHHGNHRPSHRGGHDRGYYPGYPGTPPIVDDGSGPRVTLGGRGLRWGNLDIGALVSFGGGLEPSFDVSAILGGNRGDNGGGFRGDGGSCLPTATACGTDYQELKQNMKRNFRADYVRNSSRTDRHAPPGWNDSRRT